jgi:hypothetical protein
MDCKHSEIHTSSDGVLYSLKPHITEAYIMGKCLRAYRHLDLVSVLSLIRAAVSLCIPTRFSM